MTAIRISVKLSDDAALNVFSFKELYSGPSTVRCSCAVSSYCRICKTVARETRNHPEMREYR